MMLRYMCGKGTAGNALSAEARRSLNLTISYQFLREVVTQHVIFSYFVKGVIVPKEIL